MTFQGKETLGYAIATESSRWRKIGVDDFGLKTNVGTRIKGQGFRAGITLHGKGMSAISSRIGKQSHLIGDNGAIAFDTGFHTQNLGMARTAAAELFSA